jgi:very-short-patch-repair endonuclease
LFHGFYVSDFYNFHCSRLRLGGAICAFHVPRNDKPGCVKNGLSEIIPHALMSEAEKRFFEVLETAAPSFLVCPQVAMSAIVTRPSHQNQLRYRAAFSQKRLDFVLVDRETLTARLVVELDNSSHRHRQAEDAKRDEMLTRAGYPVLRVPVQHSYNIRELSVKVRSALERR